MHGLTKSTGQPKSSTKIQVQNMTLAPKPTTPGEVKPSNTMPAGSKPASLWGGQTLANESPHQDAMATPKAIASDPWIKPEETQPAPEPVAVMNEPLPDLPSADEDAPF